MSKFTGKCDFCDNCEMIHNPQEIEKSKIYLGDARVMIKEEKDLIPYYTHLVATAIYDKENGNVIHLSRDSFINFEEREHLSWKIRNLIYAFRIAKKEKVEVTLDYLKLKKYYLSDTENFIWLSLIDKIKNNMDLIKVHLPKDYRECSYFIAEWLIPEYFNDIHDSMHNRYREEFIKFAHENGYINFDENGIYHPIIWKMCADVNEYYKMKEKYGGNI